MLASHYWQGWGNAGKKLESFWLEKTFTAMFLKQIWRETYNSAHSKSTFSPGKKAERGTPDVCATAFPPFLIKERNCEFQELKKHKEMKKSKEPASICCTLQAVPTLYTDSQIPFYRKICLL